MRPPTDPDRCLAILILRILAMSHDKVSSVVRCAKQTVGDCEAWFQQLPYDEATFFCSETAVKELVGRYLVTREEITKEELISAAQVTTDAILRRHRADYIGRQAGSPRKLSPSEKKELQLQQIEHIGKVQSLAKSTIKSYSTILHRSPYTLQPPYSSVTITIYPDDDPERAQINYNNDALFTTFHDLVRDALWLFVAAHLGEEAERIE